MERTTMARKRTTPKDEPKVETTLIRVSKTFADTIRDAAGFEKSTVAEFADANLMPVVKKRYDDAILKAAKKIEGGSSK